MLDERKWHGNMRRFLQAPIAIIDKRRIGNLEQVAVDNVIGDVAGKPCLLVNDEISSGESLVSAANTLSRFRLVGFMLL